MFELALTANEGIIYTLYSWRALASWPPVFVTGEVLSHGASVWYAFLTVLGHSTREGVFRDKKLGGEMFSVFVKFMA